MSADLTAFIEKHAVQASPGDVLVVTVPDDFTAYQAREIHDVLTSNIRYNGWDLGIIVVPGSTERHDGSDIRGSVIIEWPAPAEGQALSGWAIRVLDATTGELIPGVSEVVLVRATAVSQVWAELTVWCDEKFEPKLDGQPVLDGNGEILVATFPFLVTEMRVAV